VAKKAATPKSVEQLVLHALKTAATKPNAKWTGTSAAALFNTKEANHEAAIAECTKPVAPLLKQVDKGGALTAAGFERIAGELPVEEVRGVYDQLRDALPDDQVGAVARVMARRLAPGEQVEFIQGVIRRTPLAATELTSALEEAVAAEKIEHEARIAAAAKRKAAEDAAKQALDRAKELIEERHRNRLDSLRREWEAEGGRADELSAHTQVTAQEPPFLSATKPKSTGASEPKTSEEKDFRRDCADQLAAAWRAAWDDKKDEARDYVESAMWNIRGLELRGEVGAQATFDGKYHECPASVFTGDKVKIVRPGWVLREGDDHDYVALKAVVAKA
jgi:hypothetical protein